VLAIDVGVPLEGADGRWAALVFLTKSKASNF